ncbi:MAG: murein biosynthesis integral membrane protein MurJ [Kiritimatiellaeota bacterium]|nr:murein biosynthesis integral membrane protein MurJ [Kiritimatiellota bacterium]
MKPTKTESPSSASPHPPVLRSVSVVSAMTAVSRFGGLVREMAMAYFFGTSPLKSAFDIAFLVPNLFRRLFGEGALSSAFVPVFSETLEKEGRGQARLFAMRVITLLTLVLGVITLGGILLSYPLARVLPPDSAWQLPLPMLRIMLPYALFICVAALVSGMLNTLGRFGVSSFTPFLLNAVSILTLVGIFPFLDNDPGLRVIVLSWSVLVAGLAQIAFQLPALRRHGFRFGLCWSGLFGDPRLRRVLILMAPAALGMGVIQINVSVDKLLAYWADASAPAALEYAERIVYLPLGMFGTAFMTVLLPAFSRHAQRGDYPLMRQTLERAMRNMTLIMAPCSAGLFALAYPCIEVIYCIKGGTFDCDSAILSARALAAYAPGLLVFSFQKAMTPAFYGMQDLKTPLRVSLHVLVLNIALNITSVIFLPPGWKHVGIAASTVLSSAVNGLALAIILRRKIGAPCASGVLGPLLKAIVFATLMGALALAVHTLLTRWLGTHKLAQVIAMLGAVATGAAFYGGIVYAFARRELLEMIHEFKARRQ